MDKAERSPRAQAEKMRKRQAAALPARSGRLVKTAVISMERVAIGIWGLMVAGRGAEAVAHPEVIHALVAQVVVTAEAEATVRVVVYVAAEAQEDARARFPLGVRGRKEEVPPASAAKRRAHRRSAKVANAAARP